MIKKNGVLSALRTFVCAPCLSVALVAANQASAQTDNETLEARCWASSVDARTLLPPSASSSDVDFSSLRSGFKVYTPFKVDFSVRGIGVAPAGNAVKGTGHHHILINRKLPLDIVNGLPFDATHVHFGKGQTSAVLDLPVGKHTLRMLFADHKHVPYFIFSPEITIEVVGRRSELIAEGKVKIVANRFAETCARWYQNEVTVPEPRGTAAYFQNLRDGDAVKRRFNVRFGAEGFGVCTAEIAVDKTGYFELEVQQRGAVLEKRSLKKGETQTDFDLPPGNYALRLALVSSAGAALGPPKVLPFRVRS